jgi:ribose 1,5-bisphosphokinase
MGVSPRLIYVMGPSGCGKDSLLRYARERLAGDAAVVFAHRYITRAAAAGGENHVELTPAEFSTRLRNSLFALTWESHGHAYGVGIEIDQWLSRGATVVVNGSREYLAEAKRRYPDLLAVAIEAPAEMLLARLLARGREDHAAIQSRLDRHRAMPGTAPDGAVIANDGLLELAGEALVALVRSHAGPALCA